LSKFLVVRFSPGAAGKFFSTLLQLSRSVNSWESELEQAKKSQDYRAIQYWFSKKFNSDFANWLKNEPEIPYQTDFVSNRFNRGDDIGFDQALSYLDSDPVFQEHYANDKKIVLILNKSTIPAWLHNKATVVNLVLDDTKIKHWVYRARYKKQFLKVDEGFIIKQEHPDYCHPKRAVLAKQFNNEKIFTGSLFGFLRKYIVGDPLTNLFSAADQIVAHPSNSQAQQKWVNLSTLLGDNFIETINNLYQELELEPVNQNLLKAIVSYYLKVNNEPFFVGTSYNYAPRMRQTQALISKFCNQNSNAFCGIGDQVGKERLDEFLSTTEPAVLLTDNCVQVDKKSNQHILNIAPEYYGIHYMPFDFGELPVPDRLYSCLMNRICSVRQSWFYKLNDLGLDKGYVSFLIDSRSDNTAFREDKLRLFDQYHQQYNTIFEEQYKQTRPLVPYLNFKQTKHIEYVLAKSYVSIVIETYFDENRAISLSEKTFRALQLPRPWMLFGAAGTIEYLKSIGFLIIEDVINHDYDQMDSWIDRQTQILQQLEKLDGRTDLSVKPEWEVIAKHNQNLLKNWESQWDIKINPAIDQAKKILYTSNI